MSTEIGEPHITLEDPIEINHPNHRSLVSQRQIGADTAEFGTALRRALRQDPNVILIGEIRDEETMRTALSAAETGILVLATLHTINASETIYRVLDLFPPSFEFQARAMLAASLRAVVSQRLVNTVDGRRTPVVEVMVHSSRIADCIKDPEQTSKLAEVMAAGGYYGMQTFDQALIRLTLDGVITEAGAMEYVSSTQNFKLMLEAATGHAQVEAVQQQQIAEAAEAAANYDSPVLARQALASAPVPRAPAVVPVPPAAAPSHTTADAAATPLPAAHPRRNAKEPRKKRYLWLRR